MMERQQYSGLSVQEFCAQEYIHPVTFYYWRKRLSQREDTASPVLVPVCLEQGPRLGQHATTAIELHYPNGVRLSLPQNSSLSLIRSLILLG